MAMEIIDGQIPFLDVCLCGSNLFGFGSDLPDDAGMLGSQQCLVFR